MKLINIFTKFMQFSGFLFWLLILTVFLPGDLMGWVGVVGIYMMMFGFPFIFLILFFGNILYSFYRWYNNKLITNSLLYKNDTVNRIYSDPDDLMVEEDIKMETIEK